MKFPLSIAMSLTSISCDTRIATQDKDRLSRACLATLCELGKSAQLYMSVERRKLLASPYEFTVRDF